MIAEVEPSPGPPEPAVLPEADFLFHLYRGSELLDDNRLLEAESELEYALSLEPSDARTRGLLAVLYFRRGFYGRAVATYRTLLDGQPDDPTLRLNLALCYLKTGQSEDARTQLESLVVEDVTDTRAWGYLALALERLGYVEQAREAFDCAGQPDLARRMVEQRGASKPRPDRSHAPRSQDAPEKAGRTGDPRFEPLDSGELSLDLARPPPSARQDWKPATAALAGLAALPNAAPRHDTLAWGTHGQEPGHAAAPGPARVWAAPPPLGNFLEDTRLERLGDPPGVTLLGTHLARVELDPALSPDGFAFRLDALRSYHGKLDPEILPRQTREGLAAAQETAGETFGGIGTPFASMKGAGQLLLGPRASQRIVGFTLRDEVVFIRETAVLGFDLSLHYENGRVGHAAGASANEAIALVQLRGTGTLLLELAADLLALEPRPGGTAIRREVVIGWVGRLLPRPLSGGEAPCGQRGLLVFSGEGTVLVSAK